jgi:mannitol/fructose-specific phosphotransferase system IIA component (Ntr-type)
LRAAPFRPRITGVLDTTRILRKPDAATPPAVTVAGALTPAHIKLKLAGASKDAVLRELAQLVVDPRHKTDVDTLVKALKAREKLCSTCVEEGVAIPHSRNAIVGLVRKPVIAYGRHPGIDFGAFDGKPVRHFFLLCAPNVRQHLQLLGRLARMIRQESFRDGLRAAQTAEDILALVRRSER